MTWLGSSSICLDATVDDVDTVPRSLSTQLIDCLDLVWPLKVEESIVLFNYGFIGALACRNASRDLPRDLALGRGSFIL